jgi:Fur family ferric uptake transcriptional regulator
MSGQAEQALRASGYRLTPQRVLVWNVLRRSHDQHLSAEEICARVQQTLPTFNLASVYRTLALLAELGLAKETRLGEGPAMWEVTHDHEHHHLVCRVCGTIAHDDDPVLDQVSDRVQATHGFAAEEVDLVVTGVCAGCRAAAG